MYNGNPEPRPVYVPCSPRVYREGDGTLTVIGAYLLGRRVVNYVARTADGYMEVEPVYVRSLRRVPQ